MSIPPVYDSQCPIESIRPAPRNVRQHTDEQIERIAKSITAFGFTAPILTDESGTILAGHGRYAAAKKLGLVIVPTVTISGLSDEQKRLYLIADNKLTDKSYFELPDLKHELLDLDTGAIDLTLSGFSQAELAELLGETKPPPKDDAEATEELPVARIGDIWRLGSNFLVVGHDSQTEEIEACKNADMVLKGWQKSSKEKAVLHTTDQTGIHAGLL